MKKHWLAKLKRRLTRHRQAVRLLAVTGGLTLLLGGFFVALKPAFNFVGKLVRGPATAISLVKDPQGILTSTRGRTNLLLLGMGGANHEGPELTDSLIVLSLDLNSKDTVLLSIPRDIWIESLKTKVNAVYFYGEQKRQGGGILLTKAAVEEVIGQPVHYALTLDFQGFKDAIDLVGGIDIEVPESFDDDKYPIPGMEDAEPEQLRYEHLHFDAGSQTMDGERTLKYVRSRNAPGLEGTDFARTRRQQQVLIAFKAKVFSAETILSPTRIKELIRTFAGSVKTDISEAEYLAFAKLAIQGRDETLRHGFLQIQDEETGGEGVLTNPDPLAYDGQWVLIGEDGSWEKVHTYVEGLLYQGTTDG